MYCSILPVMSTYVSHTTAKSKRSRSRSPELLNNKKILIDYERQSPPLSPGSESDLVSHHRPPSSEPSIDDSRCSTAHSDATTDRPLESPSCRSPSPSPSTSSTKEGSLTTSAPNPCAEFLKPKCNCPELERVECRLENKDLWEKFNELGTEMIITKTGRYGLSILLGLAVLRSVLNMVVCSKLTRLCNR